MSESCHSQCTLPVLRFNLSALYFVRGVAVSMHNGLKSRTLCSEKRQVISTVPLSLCDSVSMCTRLGDSIAYMSFRERKMQISVSNEEFL